MAFERLTKDARAAVNAASENARSTGHGTVEAEHLLLALAASTDVRTLGLDPDALTTALAQEEERSLAAVGVAAGDFQMPIGRGNQRKPKLATSFKLALQDALTTTMKRGERRIQTGHLLHGVLAAEHGRVPRALQIAGIDIHELRARV